MLCSSDSYTCAKYLLYPRPSAGYWNAKVRRTQLSVLGLLTELWEHNVGVWETLSLSERRVWWGCNKRGAVESFQT